MRSRRFFERTITRSVVMTVLQAAGLPSQVVLAQDSSIAETTPTTSTDVNEIPATANTWNASLGAGAGVRPTYLGSNRYQGAPVLLANVNYDDMITLGVGGLSVYWHHDGLRIGGGLTRDGGRKDYATHGLFTQGDDRLMGLGNIDAALGVRAFASFTLGGAVFEGSATKLTNVFNDGFYIDAGVTVPYALSNRLTLSPHLRSTWANRNYMQTHFGITPVRAEDSAFAAFGAKAGVENVLAGVDATYLLTRHWFVRSSANVNELVGDAGKSPITFDSINAVVTLVVGYRFQ